MNLPKRLTKKQKEEILKNFQDGYSIESLSQKYNCTKVTITRNLKINLGEERYQLIVVKNKLDNKRMQNSNYSFENKAKNNLKKENNNVLKSNNSLEEELFQGSDFIEIAPLNVDIENTSQKDLSSIPISEVNLPKTVYMIVDKKVELEIKYLKDYPKWQFLSKDELEKKTIEIYYDLKIAKSFCQNEQKVIKVPNSNIFKIVAPILSSRGITRIISAENLIAL